MKFNKTSILIVVLLSTLQGFSQDHDTTVAGRQLDGYLQGFSPDHDTTVAGN